MNNALRFISFEIIAICHMIVCIILSNLFVVDDALTSFLSIPTFIYMPFLFGKILLPQKIAKKNNFCQNFIVDWFIGIISITFIALLFEAINVLNLKTYSFSIVVLITFFTVLKKYFTRHIDDDVKFLNVYLKHLFSLLRTHFPFLIALGWSVFLFLFLYGGNPFPTTFAGDELRFTIGALQTVENSLIPQLGPYFPYLPLLQAIGSALFNIHPVCFVYSGIFLMYSFFTFSIYLFIFSLSKDSYVAMLGTFFANSAFFSKTINLSRFVPMTWVYILFPLILLCIYNVGNWKKTKSDNNIVKKFVIYALFSIPLMYFFSTALLATLNYQPILRVVAFLFLWVLSIILIRFIFNDAGTVGFSSIILGLIFLHHDLAMIGMLLVYLIVFLQIVKESNNYSVLIFKKINYHKIKLYNLINYLIFSICFLVLLLFEYFPLPDRYIGSYFGIGFFEKINILVFSYTPIVLIFFIIGVFYSIARRIRLTLVMSTLVIITIFFINVSLAIRSMIFLTPFISYFASYIFKKFFKF